MYVYIYIYIYIYICIHVCIYIYIHTPAGSKKLPTPGSSRGSSRCRTANPYALHSTPYTLLLTPYNLHPTRLLAPPDMALKGEGSTLAKSIFSQRISPKSTPLESQHLKSNACTQCRVHPNEIRRKLTQVS